MAIDISQIISEYEQRYIPGSQSVRSLTTQLFAPSETDDLFLGDVRRDDATEIQLSNVDQSNVLQGYQDGYTPMGTSTWTPRVIKKWALKIDYLENPTKIWNSWLGFLAGKGLDRTEWPITRYILEVLVLPKATDNWERRAVYGGVQVDPTPGTAQSVEHAVDGIRKQINDAITATTLSPIALGAVPTDPIAFGDYVESFVKGIDALLRANLDGIVMSRTLAARFKEGMRRSYNMNYAQADLVSEINYGIPVKGVLSHEGATKIWATTPENKIIGWKNAENSSVFQMQAVDRSVKAFTDYWKGTGFKRMDLLATNDVELS